jgi:glycosyltransferase involved in cell wall biosynthesis
MINYEFPQMKYAEQKSLISIIVPIYNTNEIYIRECLDSILAQTFMNWEAILVNDGSTGSIEKIIDEYAEKDPRFIAVHKRNEGTLLARKTGLENSKGEFIANIDHDDKYHPQFLEKMYAKIIEANTDFVWCKCQIMDKKEVYYMSDYEWNVDACENVVMMMTHTQGPTWHTWNKLIKREIYAKVRFPNIKIILGEDPIQVLQIAYYSKSAVFISENLYFHELTGFSSIRNIISSINVTININNTLQNLFSGVIPQNVKNIFYCKFRRTPYYYYKLNKKQRQEFKKELEPLLSDFLKLEKNLNLKICLFLASKGIEFPFKWIMVIIKFIGRRAK